MRSMNGEAAGAAGRRLSQGVTGVIAVAACALAFAVGTAYGKPARTWMASLIYAARVRTVMATQWDTLIATGATIPGRGPGMVMIEFSDYECPFCRRANLALDSLLPLKAVRVSYHHLPIDALHPAAHDAAKAAICAERQGHFLAMHHYLMTTSAWQLSRDWTAAAVGAGVTDTAQFSACLMDPSTEDRLIRDRKVAERLGISGTPSFFAQKLPIENRDLAQTVTRLDSAVSRSR